MANMGICFSELVLASYTVYRNISIRNDLTQQLTYINFIACSFFTIYCISVINYGSGLMNEVHKNAEHKILRYNLKYSKIIMFCNRVKKRQESSIKF